MYIFFNDDTIKKQRKIFGNLDENKGAFWGLAALFNDVVMALPEFVEIHGIKKVVGYPAHKQYINHMEKLWVNNPDIDNWLIEAFNYLKEINYSK